MLNCYTVSFFGHRYIDNPLNVQNVLEKYLMQIVDQHEYVDFLVGRNGDFDMIAASAVRRVQKNCRDDNSCLILMLPYNTAEYRNNKNFFEEYYNEIRICFSSELVHPKNAIQTRNKEMVVGSDLVICYVNENNGGAYKTMEYAKKTGKKIINLAETKNR